MSTGSLHRHHHQVHISTCPHYQPPQQQQQYYYQFPPSGGSGRASSLSLTAPSQSQSATAGGGAGTTSTGIPNMALTLLQGNFLLNAFGNCKTSKNSDASRFGKLVQLQIDFLGNVCGGRILTYQLEKWRVQGPIQNSGGPSPSSTDPLLSTTAGVPTSSNPPPHYERNFHIFYILLAGADSSTLKALRLTRNLETYTMLNVRNHSSFLSTSQTNPSTPFCPHDHYYQKKGSRQGSSCYEGCFQLIKNTLASVLSSSSSSSSSISADHVFRILAAILKLNNLVFAPVANIDGTEGCDVTNEQGIVSKINFPCKNLKKFPLLISFFFLLDLHDLGHLLSIVPSASSVYSPTTPNNGSNNHNHQHPLKTILTTRRVSRSDGSVAQVELTSSESSSLRNSLTISLYTRLFAWLTKQVNFNPTTATSTPHGKPDSATSSSMHPTATTTATPSSSTSASKHNLLNIIDFYGFEVFQINSIEQFLVRLFKANYLSCHVMS